jgi:hypothetical protein
MDLTIAVPMSGPYSISGEMVSFTMGDNEYNFCAYLGSAFLSAKMAHFDLLSDTELEDVFVPEYAQLIRQYESETIGLFTMNDIMVAKLKENGGKVLPKRMLKDDFRIDFMANPNNPLKLALRRMDICNWVPVAPVKMLYCKADDQVTYRNAVYTDSLMRANGALNVSAQDVLTTGNHSTCFYPALLKMISIFNGLQRIDPLSDINELPEEEITAWPNPASGHLNIEVNGNVDQQFKVSIYNSLGRKVFNSVVKSSSVQSIELSKFETGIYYILFYKRDHLISRDKFSVIK